jgi:hypothetical protein
MMHNIDKDRFCLLLPLVLLLSSSQIMPKFNKRKAVSSNGSVAAAAQKKVKLTATTRNGVRHWLKWIFHQEGMFL